MGTQYLAGTSGWVYNHWKTSFYPAGLPQSRWFGYYAGRFPTVEVNATFYRFFADSTYEKWREQAPEGFKYVLKAPRLITHLKKLVNAESEIRSFWHSAQILGDKLGLILLQVAPQMPYNPSLLRAALEAFGEPGRVAVEFRSEDWLNEEIRALLAELGAVFVSVDSPKQKPLDWITSAAGYIRLHGRSRWYSHDYTPAELRGIAEVAKRMGENGAKEVYIFFNNDFESYAPKNALQLMEMLGE